MPIRLTSVETHTINENCFFFDAKKVESMFSSSKNLAVFRIAHVWTPCMEAVQTKIKGRVNKGLFHFGNSCSSPVGDGKS